MADYFKKPKIYLNEQEIRYAMANTQSNKAASLFLRVDISTYKKYAMQYFDAASGKNLYDLHKNQPGKFIRRTPHNQVKVNDILDGKHPNYSHQKMKQRFIDEGVLMDKCNRCGFHALRSDDLRPPTILVFKDGDEKHLELSNLEICCFNCVFLHYPAYGVNFKIRKTI